MSDEKNADQMVGQQMDKGTVAVGDYISPSYHQYIYVFTLLPNHTNKKLVD